MTDFTPERHRPPMVCIHSEDGEKDAAALLERVYAELECDATTLLTNVVATLHWNYNVSIESLPTDQWSAVYSERSGNIPGTTKDMEFSERYGTIETCYIECDRLEHGIAATYEFWSKRLTSTGEIAVNAPGAPS